MPEEGLQNKTKNFSISRILPELFFHRKPSFGGRVGVFCIFKCVFLKTTFTTNYCHIEGSKSRNFVSLQGYSIMTDNLKRAGIFTFTFRMLGVFADEL